MSDRGREENALEQSAAKLWVELVLKYGAVLIGFIYICGFLNLVACANGLGIYLSEVSLQNADLLTRGTTVMLLFSTPPLASGLAGVIGTKKIKLRWLRFMVGASVALYFSLAMTSMSIGNGLVGQEVVLFFLVEMLLSFAMLFQLGFGKQSSIMMQIFLVILAFCGPFSLAIVLGGKQTQFAEIPKGQIQLIVEPASVSELSQGGITFEAGKQISNPVNLIYTNDHSYFVRPDGGSLVEIARGKVASTVRSQAMLRHDPRRRLFFNLIDGVRGFPKP